MYTEGLGKSHAGSLAISSNSVSAYEPRLTVSVGFLVMSLNPVDPTILAPSLQKESPSLA